MIITRRFPRHLLTAFAVRVSVVPALWATTVVTAYLLCDLPELRLPFLPVASIGTAVAFYIGFKNNSAYDRFWEGRKIWGGVVNASRTWATSVMSYVDPTDQSDQARETRRVLIYRHLAWINALRLQLRKSSRFFHKPARSTRKRLEAHADAMRNDWDQELSPFLSSDEMAEMSARNNTATHLLLKQGQELAQLVEDDRLDMFRQLELMGVVEEFYALQGKCERIKNTPFPRQYAEFSRLFVKVFVAMLPFGMLDVFATHATSNGSTGLTIAKTVLMIVATTLVSWVFLTMEGIGDSSEDPFERSFNDVPMNALCRTIEIDLREMLGETDLPEKKQPVGFVLY